MALGFVRLMSTVAIGTSTNANKVAPTPEAVSGMLIVHKQYGLCNPSLP